MKNGTPATYALLALLGIRPWSSYELTKQARRSLRFVWPSSEAHLYREQLRLVEFGWARLREEQVGERVRRHYSITPAGRAALRRWLRTEPSAAHLEIEGALRAFFADLADVADLVRSLEATAQGARGVVDDLVGFASEYLEGRAPFPDRLHAIAVAMDLLTQTYAAVERACTELAADVGRWDTTVGRGMTADTRRRFRAIVERHERR